MVSAAAAKVLGAVFKIPLTNMLGGVGMSYFSCAYSIFMPVYALTVTGLSAAVARMTARSAALGMYANARRIRRTALLLFSAAGLAGSLLILLLAVPFSVYTVGSRDGAAAVAMIAPAVVFGCITAVERGVLRRHEQYVSHGGLAACRGRGEGSGRAFPLRLCHCPPQHGHGAFSVHDRCPRSRSSRRHSGSYPLHSRCGCFFCSPAAL